MTNAAIYTRVSTDDQADNGYGLPVQLEKCRAMAVVKDFEVVATLSDNGISGTKDQTERDGLAQLLQLAEDKAIDVVIVHALDRLGRNTRLVLSIVEKLETLGIDLISCKEALDTTTPTGRFVLRMFASLGELERDNIVERTTSGRDARGKIDGEKGGSVPFGYVRLTGLVVDNDRADVVKEIFNRSDNLNWSMLKIANWLNEQGIKTARGKKWYASSVKVVLGNREKYQGGLRGDSNETWPKIL